MEQSTESFNQHKELNQEVLKLGNKILLYGLPFFIIIFSLFGVYKAVWILSIDFAAIIIVGILLKKNINYGLAYWLFAIVSLASMVFGFFYTNGFYGPTAYVLIPLILILSLSCKAKFRKAWIFFGLILLTILCVLQYLDPTCINMLEGLSHSALQGIISIAIPVLIASIFFPLTTYYQNQLIKSNLSQKKFNSLLENKEKTLKEKTLELEEITNQKDRLFSIIGHDLRNPLASIEGYLQTLDYDIDNATRDTIKAQLLELCQNSRGLLDNLLEWAKKDTNVNLETLSAKEVALKAIETLKPIAFNKQIDISVLMDEDEAKVLADKNMLEMVIRNLVGNAIKFSDEGGKVKIRAYTRTDYIEISVEDTGIGMNKEESKNIFTPNRKIRTGTSEEKGIGLGLILTREFVEKMNGTISCSSVLGKGSTFKFNLPTPNYLNTQT